MVSAAWDKGGQTRGHDTCEINIAETLFLQIENDFLSATHSCLRCALAKCGRKFDIFGIIFLHFTYRFFHNFKIHSHIALVPQIIPSITFLSTFPTNQKASSMKKCFPGKLLLGEQHKNSTIRHPSSTLRFFFFMIMGPHPMLRFFVVPVAWGGGLKLQETFQSI
jgi:hypothetical protein